MLVEFLLVAEEQRDPLSGDRLTHQRVAAGLADDARGPSCRLQGVERDDRHAVGMGIEQGSVRVD